jgi:hypothetical protein
MEAAFRHCLNRKFVGGSQAFDLFGYYLRPVNPEGAENLLGIMDFEFYFRPNL